MHKGKNAIIEADGERESELNRHTDTDTYAQLQTGTQEVQKHDGTEIHAHTHLLHLLQSHPNVRAKKLKKVCLFLKNISEIVITLTQKF